MITEFSDALERFNRKERNLAVCHILGCKATPPKLDKEFCATLKERLDLRDEVPADAWWATDYHISWIAGALAVYCRAKPEPWSNQPIAIRTQRSPIHNVIKRQIAEGNQEDVDLLIANNNDLILIECKAYGRWDSKQLESKLARIKLVKAFYENELKSGRGINFHFLLLSPKPLSELNQQKAFWPKWVYRKSAIPWIKLERPLCDKQILEVGRCNSSGYRQQQGSSYWGIFKLNGKRLKVSEADWVKADAPCN